MCQSLFFNKVAGLEPAIYVKKETLIQVFSCESCEIFTTNTFFYRKPLVAASANYVNNIPSLSKKSSGMKIKTPYKVRHVIPDALLKPGFPSR